MAQMEEEFVLDLCVTQSQNDNLTFSQNNNQTFSQHSVATLTQFSDITFVYSSDEYEKEVEKELCLFVYANELEEIQREKRIHIFSKKMQARKRLGSANIIKRAICKKGLRRRFSSALKLIRLTDIYNKLKRKRSLYY